MEKIFSRRVLKKLIIPLIVAGFTAISAYIKTTYFQKQVIENPQGLYYVQRIIDGDTIVVLKDGKEDKVRLIGVDTPELDDPRQQVNCFAKLASKKTSEVLLGKNVYLEADSTQQDKDRYQRLLRYVFLEDRTNFNFLLIKEGYAYEYTYQVPYGYQKAFKEAQKRAAENKLGLWGENCIL